MWQLSMEKNRNRITNHFIQVILIEMFTILQLVTDNIPLQRETHRLNKPFEITLEAQRY